MTEGVCEKSIKKQRDQPADAAEDILMYKQKTKRGLRKKVGNSRNRIYQVSETDSINHELKKNVFIFKEIISQCVFSKNLREDTFAFK